MENEIINKKMLIMIFIILFSIPFLISKANEIQNENDVSIFGITDGQLLASSDALNSKSPEFYRNYKYNYKKGSKFRFNKLFI